MKFSRFRGFERSLMRESKADLMIYANAVNGMKAALSSAYLSQIIADYNHNCDKTLR